MFDQQAGFAAFALMNVVTGVVLYQTYATADEIARANENLRNRGLDSRFCYAAAPREVT